MLTEQFRNAISEGSDTGMLVAADALQESADATENSLGELLRAYVDVQTYIRMSQPTPPALADRFVELQGKFRTPERRRIEGDYWGSEYRKPLGTFYTELSIAQEPLANNLNLLSIEPIRTLEISDCTADDNLKMILRNYRMNYMVHLRLMFSRTRRTTNIQMEVAKAVATMKAPMLQSLSIHGLVDRTKKIQAMFMMNRDIARNCVLRMADSWYSTPERLQTHK
jgi:hypothetical protein